MKITAEKIFENAHISLVNTRQNRFRDVYPKVEKVGQKLLLTLGEKTLYLDFLDEIILYLILTFRYAPGWLVFQWLETNTSIGSDVLAHERVKKYIDFGLLYEYPTAISMFLMPTNLLASLFSASLGKFRDPSYNILTHEVSEMDILFKLFLGDLTFQCENNAFPYVSHFFERQSGSQALTEHSFNKSLNYFKGSGKGAKADDVRETLNLLSKEIQEGKQITTPDMKEKRLALYQKNNKGLYDVKVPDIAILAPRKIEKGIALPQSVALEVELVAKRPNAYEKALSMYWNNVIYGKVIYLITNQNTLKNIKAAYKKLFANKKPTCIFEIKNYEIPYNKKEIL